MDLNQFQASVNRVINRFQEMDKIVSEINSGSQPKLLINMVDSSSLIYGLDGLVNGGPIEKLASIGLIATDYAKQPATQGLFSYVVGMSRIKRLGFKEHFRRSVPISALSLTLAVVK